MIEYLYDAIKAVAEQDIAVYAFVTDDEENVITEGCRFVLHDQDRETMLASVDGEYIPESMQMQFVLPASATIGLRGRYWYCIQHNNNNLCFKQPIYLL